MPGVVPRSRVQIKHQELTQPSTQFAINLVSLEYSWRTRARDTFRWIEPGCQVAAIVAPLRGAYVQFLLTLGTLDRRAHHTM